MQEKDLKNYSIRTDLVVDMMDSNFTSQKIISKKETFQDIQILEVTITSDENELKKKKGKYITISYQDVTDKINFQNLEKVVIKDSHLSVCKSKPLPNADMILPSLKPFVNTKYTFPVKKRGHSHAAAPSRHRQSGVTTPDSSPSPC